MKVCLSAIQPNFNLSFGQIIYASQNVTQGGLMLNQLNYATFVAVDI
jgi:hypothetical protein